MANKEEGKNTMNDNMNLLLWCKIVSFKLYDAICGFVHPGEDDRGEGNQDAQFPEVAEVKKRLEEQEVK